MLKTPLSSLSLFLLTLFMGMNTAVSGQTFSGVTVQDTCLGDATQFSFGAVIIPDSVLWTFDDATAAPNDTSTQFTPGYTYGNSGTYAVSVVGYWTDALGAVITDTGFYSVTILPDLNVLADSTILCGNSVVLDASYPGAAGYLWSTGSTTSTTTAPSNGIYFVSATTPCGVIEDTTFVQLFPQLVANLGPNFGICVGDTIPLTPGLNFNNGVSYLWSNGATTSSIDIFAAGTYAVTVTDSCYTAIDSITITIPPTFSFNLGPDTVLCPGDTIILDPNIGLGNLQYVWSNNVFTPTNVITGPGTYSVVVTNDCDFVRDTIVIFSPPPIAFDLGNDTTLCVGDVLTLDPTAGLPVEVPYTLSWSDGSSNATLDISSAGTFAVTVSDPCTSFIDSISVTIPSGISVDLGNDTTYCAGDLITVSPNLIGNFNYLWSDGSTNSSLDVTAVGTYWVEVSNDCDVSSDTIVFNPFSGFTVNIGNDTTICADKPYLIDLNAYPNSSYQWSDGSQDDIYLVDAPGEYYVDVQNICDTVRSNIIRVTLEPCDCKFYVPNAFSPNRDGSNETFYPQSNCIILEYQFYVYNRWGQEVFRTNSNFIGWDGTYKDEPSPTGLYSYRIFYKAIRTTGEIYQESLIGNVYLLR